MTFDSVYYSPYQVQSDDDDDAPVTKKHLKELHEKIDSLITSSSSSSRSTISKAAIQGLVDTFTKAHEASINSATATIDASTKACAAATEKVEKLFVDANSLLQSLQGAADSNAEKLDSLVHKLATSVTSELHVW